MVNLKNDIIEEVRKFLRTKFGSRLYVAESVNQEGKFVVVGIYSTPEEAFGAIQLPATSGFFEGRMSADESSDGEGKTWWGHYDEEPDLPILLAQVFGASPEEALDIILERNRQ